MLERGVNMSCFAALQDWQQGWDSERLDAMDERRKGGESTDCSLVSR